MPVEPRVVHISCVNRFGMVLSFHAVIAAVVSRLIFLTGSSNESYYNVNHIKGST
jgi:hypothetical protein